eukprot:scpid48239/ scgid15955/ 
MHLQSFHGQLPRCVAVDSSSVPWVRQRWHVRGFFLVLILFTGGSIFFVPATAGHVLTALSMCEGAYSQAIALHFPLSLTEVHFAYGLVRTALVCVSRQNLK